MKEEFDILQHTIVPRHIILSQEETKEFLEKHNVTLAQLPKISRKDPAIIRLQVAPGSVIKIIRKSETAGETIYYRSIAHD